MVSLSHLALVAVSVDEGTRRAAYRSEGFCGATAARLYRTLTCICICFGVSVLGLISMISPLLHVGVWAADSFRMDS